MGVTVFCLHGREQDHLLGPVRKPTPGHLWLIKEYGVPAPSADRETVARAQSCGRGNHSGHLRIEDSRQSVRRFDVGIRLAPPLLKRRVGIGQL